MTSRIAAKVERSVAFALLLGIWTPSPATAVDCSVQERDERDAGEHWQMADQAATRANQIGALAQARLPAAQQALQQCTGQTSRGFTPRGGQSAACAAEAAAVQNLQNSLSRARQQTTISGSHTATIRTPKPHWTTAGNRLHFSRHPRHRNPRSIRRCRRAWSLLSRRRPCRL
jgi:hypothetical protein